MTAATTRVRVSLGAIGLAGIGYGLNLLLDRADINHPLQVAKWAIGSDIVVDGFMMPVVVGVGWLLARVLRPRARRYLQGALATMALTTLIALPLIHRRDQAQPGQALLMQNYAGNLAVLLGLTGGAYLCLYLARVAQDHRSSTRNVRDPADQVSPSE